MIITIIIANIYWILSMSYTMLNVLYSIIQFNPHKNLWVRYNCKFILLIRKLILRLNKLSKVSHFVVKQGFQSPFF